MKLLSKLVVLMMVLTLPVLAQNPKEEDEFLPQAKTHLRGRQIDPTWFESVISKSDSKTDEKVNLEVVTPADIRSLIAGEQQRLRSSNVAQLAKAGISSSFKDTISLIPLEGKFEILALYSSVNDNYIRTVEGAIRSNVFPPLIARANQQKTSVSVVFTIKKDGAIIDIEKESTTGSNALDGAAISACRSSSPLPPLSNTGNENIIRMRFTLTYYP